MGTEEGGKKQSWWRALWRLMNPVISGHWDPTPSNCSHVPKLKEEWRCSQSPEYRGTCLESRDRPRQVLLETVLPEAPKEKRELQATSKFHGWSQNRRDLVTTWTSHQTFRIGSCNVASQCPSGFRVEASKKIHLTVTLWVHVSGNWPFPWRSTSPAFTFLTYKHGR